MTDTSPPRSQSPVQMSSVLASVERQLHDLWTQTTPDEPQRTRVCTMNLVVIASSDEIAAAYVPIVDTLTQSVPSRAIVVTIDGSTPEMFLEGNVSAICGIDDERTCSERVTLRASGAACARIASAIDALIVPELPTTLVWLGRVYTDDPIFRELAQGAERVILDSQLTSFGSVRALVKWTSEQRHRGPGVADLAWTRLSIWQEMCARFFDDPAMRPLASGFEELRVAQVCDRGARLGPEASLFLGWLAARLGWRTERVAGALRLRRADGRLLNLVLSAATAQAAPPLVLARVSFRAAASGVEAEGSLTREQGSSDSELLRYRLDVNLPCSGEQTVRLGQNRGARLLERTLRRPPHDPVLEEAIAFAEQLSELGMTTS